MRVCDPWAQADNVGLLGDKEISPLTAACLCPVCVYALFLYASCPDSNNLNCTWHYCTQDCCFHRFNIWLHILVSPSNYLLIDTVRVTDEVVVLRREAAFWNRKPLFLCLIIADWSFESFSHPPHTRACFKHQAHLHGNIYHKMILGRALGCTNEVSLFAEVGRILRSHRPTGVSIQLVENKAQI